MSSINPHPTFNYSQPSEYRFSHDSVFLARFVFEYVRKNKVNDADLLDLCSGCGIVGLDYLFHQAVLGEPGQALSTKTADFMEIQEIYREHFEENLRRFKLHFPISTQTSFLKSNYADCLNIPEIKKYDLILCNPPYFHGGTGKLSPSEFKNRCRFFLDSDLPTLFLAITSMLKPRGQAFVLVSTPPSSASASHRAMDAMKHQLKFEKVGDIRGTDLYRITLLNQC